MASWSSLECSPACHAGDRGFKSHRGRLEMARYANWQSGEAQTFVTAGSTPALATGQHASAGHRRAQVIVNHPPQAVQVQFLPGALKLWPVRLSVRTLAPQAGKAGSIPARATEHDQVAQLVDARRSERRAARLGSSNLPLVTLDCRRAGAQLAFIRPVRPARYRGLQLAGGRRLNRAS